MAQLTAFQKHRAGQTRLFVGAFASIAAIVFELGNHNHCAPELAWAAVHTSFALHYAHEYYRGAKPGGLQFPSDNQREDADYWMFVYFSFLIGMTVRTGPRIERNMFLQFIRGTPLSGLSGV